MSDITKHNSRVNFKKIKVDLICEWCECDFTTENFNLLKDHLINHLREIYNIRSKNNQADLDCGICNEKLSTDLSSIRHLNYHAYIFNLKSRGRYLKKMYKLNDCQADVSKCNAVPPLKESFLCQWINCEYSTEDVSEFFDHIDNHPFFEDFDETKENSFECKWSDCQFATCTPYRLLVHLKLHCEKRYVACFQCGVCFSTTAKYIDHLKRQLVNDWYKHIEEEEMKEVLCSLSNKVNPMIPVPKPLIETPKDAFKCSLCQHLFATKRMLKEHERRHISSLNCPHCSHSCSTRYALKRHILFRHTEEKPFTCDQCDKSFKCNDVLRRHIEAVHTEMEGPYVCEVVGCNFEGKNYRALQIHRGKAHLNIQTITTKVYVCHKCDQEFVKGYLLTNHLTKVHGIHRVHHRVRHQYKICKDGKYRLNLFDIKLKSSVSEQDSEIFMANDKDARQSCLTSLVKGDRNMKFNDNSVGSSCSFKNAQMSMKTELLDYKELVYNNNNDDNNKNKNNNININNNNNQFIANYCEEEIVDENVENLKSHISLNNDFGLLLSNNNSHLNSVELHDNVCDTNMDVEEEFYV